MLYSFTSCSLGFISWLQDHLLPCPFKYLTGLDCPGCGFQRAVVALFKGDLHSSLMLYPAAIPLLMVWAYTFADKRFNWDTHRGLIKKSSYIAVAALILISYTVKMVHLYVR